MAPASLPLLHYKNRASAVGRAFSRLSQATSAFPSTPAGRERRRAAQVPTQPMVRHRISWRKLPAPPVVCVQFGKISRGLETPGGRRGEAAAGHKQVPARRSQMESGGSGGGALRGETQPGRPLASCLPKGTGGVIGLGDSSTR